MQFLLLIRGLPGSGKSTMAKELIYYQTNWHHLEADMFHIIDGVYKFDATKMKYAHSWCQQATKEWLELGESVVVSNTFTERWEMMPYYAIAKELNIPVHEMVCGGQFESVHNVPEEVIERMKDRWQD